MEPMPLPRSSVLTDEQAETLAALTDRLIPPDPETPGGADGGALAYIVRGLEDGGRLSPFRSSYALLLDALATEGFAARTPADQDAVLHRLEQSGDAAARRALAQVAEQAQEGYYTEPANWPAIGYIVTEGQG